MQFPGKKKFPFSSIVLVRTYDNETLMTGFITDEYPDGRCSVFVPTGPNSTTGLISPELSDCRGLPDSGVVAEDARFIISCRNLKRSI